MLEKHGILKKAQSLFPPTTPIYAYRRRTTQKTINMSFWNWKSHIHTSHMGRNWRYYDWSDVYTLHCLLLLQNVWHTIYNIYRFKTAAAVENKSKNTPSLFNLKSQFQFCGLFSWLFHDEIVVFLSGLQLRAFRNAYQTGFFLSLILKQVHGKIQGFDNWPKVEYPTQNV